MYVGHVAIALALRARRPAAPMALLAAAAYGPDFVEMAGTLVIGEAASERYSHCLWAVLLGAAASWLLAVRPLGARTAGAVALAWLSHWPADFLTAYKPLLDVHHLVGLDLYNAPLADFVVEGLLVVIAAALYARAVAGTPRARTLVAGVAGLLLGMQGVLDFGMSRMPQRPWRPQLTFVLEVDGSSSLRMALALSLANFTVSEQWHRTAYAASSPWSA